MANVSGIAIVIKAFLPTGKTLDEQYTALTLVKEAHAAGDYSKLLKAATVDEVKTEQKTRRIDDAPQTATSHDEPTGAENAVDGDATGQEPAGEDSGDENVPEFLKNSRKGKAA